MRVAKYHHKAIIIPRHTNANVRSIVLAGWLMGAHVLHWVVSCAVRCSVVLLLPGMTALVVWCRPRCPMVLFLFLSSSAWQVIKNRLPRKGAASIPDILPLCGDSPKSSWLRVSVQAFFSVFWLRTQP